MPDADSGVPSAPSVGAPAVPSAGAEVRSAPGSMATTTTIPAAKAPLLTRLRALFRGEPIGVPTHALVIHFPAALLPTSLFLDLVAIAAPDLVPPQTATILLVLGLLGGALAAGTGLLDWLEMLPGPRRRRVTRHMLVQATGLAAFLASLVVRLVAPDPGGMAPMASLAASAIGTALLFAGDHLGGLLVYRDAMRVRTSRGR